jgi:hypothetical protein
LFLVAPFLPVVVRQPDCYGFAWNVQQLLSVPALTGCSCQPGNMLTLLVNGIRMHELPT